MQNSVLKFKKLKNWPQKILKYLRKLSIQGIKKLFTLYREIIMIVNSAIGFGFTNAHFQKRDSLFKPTKKRDILENKKGVNFEEILQHEMAS
ncbi:MAG: hypothetical protein HQM14_20200 [SAR324 cluster bacterium]|nr:hypothetical protein [SAR324 cluster bacterium]